MATPDELNPNASTSTTPEFQPHVGLRHVDPSLVVPFKPGDKKLKGVGFEPEGEKDVFGQFKDWATSEPTAENRSILSPPEGIRGAISPAVRAAAYLLPGSTTEAAIDIALGGASKVAKVAKVVGIPDFLGKIASWTLPAATGAASEAIQGRSATGGAATGATAQILGATVGKLFGGRDSIVGNFFTKIKTASTTRLHNQIADELAPALADRVSKDLPTLSPYLGGIDGVKELVIPQKGTRQIGKLLDNVEAQIKGQFKRGAFNVSEDAYRIARGEPLPEVPSTVSISMSDFVDFRRILKDHARELMKKEGTTGIRVAINSPTTLPSAGAPPPNSVRMVDVGALADKVEADLLQSISNNPRLHKKFETALNDYGKTIDLRDALLPDYNKIFPTYPNVKSSTFDPVAMYSAMNKSADKITHERFPELYRLFEGNTRGVGPRWEKLSLPGRFASGNGVRVVESMPSIPYLSVPKHMRQILFPNTPPASSGVARNLGTITSMAAVPPAASALTSPQQQTPEQALGLGFFAR